MPTYRITDPTSGKTLKLTGDSPPTEQELNDIFGSQPKSKSSIESNHVYRAASKAQEIRRGNTKFEDVKENLIGAGKTTLEQAKNIVNSGLFGIPGRINKNLAPQGLNKGEEIAGSFLGGEVIGTPIINAGLKGIQKAYNLPGVKENKVVDYAVSKYKSIFKPKLIAKTAGQVGLSDEKIANGLTAIHNNKASIRLGDEIGRLPETLEEGISSASQTKDKIFKEYTALRQSMGDSVSVDMGNISKSLKEEFGSKAVSFANPEAQAYAIKEADRIAEFGKVSLDDAENIIKQYNAKLDGFYGKSVPVNDASKLTVDANIASLLRSELDNVILSTPGKSYQALKSQYGAVVEVEKNFVKALNKVSRTQKIPGVSTFDTVPIIYGAFTGNTALMASGITQKILKGAVNRMKDPGLAVKSIFKALDKSGTPTRIQSLINIPLKGTAITAGRKDSTANKEIRRILK